MLAAIKPHLAPLLLIITFWPIATSFVFPTPMKEENASKGEPLSIVAHFSIFNDDFTRMRNILLCHSFVIIAVVHGDII